jgi:hypothetical protein
MKYRFLVEILLLILIYLFFVSFSIYRGVIFSQTLFWVHIDNVTSGVIVGIIFFGNVFYLYPKYFSESKKAYAGRALLMLIVLYFIESIAHAYKASALIKDQRGLDVSPLDMLFQHFNIQDSILLVSITFLVSMIYVYIKGLILKKNKLAPTR